MHLLKKPWMILMILTIVVVGVFLMKDTFTQASPLSIDEMHDQLSAMYDGDVESLALRGDVYEAIIVKDGAEYTVQAHAESGKVLSLEKVKDAPSAKNPEESTEIPTEEADPSKEAEAKDQQEHEEDNEREETTEDAETPEEPEESSNDKTPPKKEPTKLISEEEAAQIGLAELSEDLTGEIDDIDFKESTDGGYYLVEIEIDTDDDLDEVIYQIHAISGEVMSVTWDD